MEAKLYQAAIYYRENKLNDALERLVEVGNLVSTLGYDGFLLADGDEVLDVLRFGAARRVGGATFVRLVERLTQGPEIESDAGNTHSEEPSSDRLPPIRVHSFGHPRVFLDSHEVSDQEWRSRKSKELFFFLLCNRRVNTNEQIMEALWPDVSADLSGSVLKTTIYRLRQALFFDCILSKEDGYCIC